MDKRAVAVSFLMLVAMGTVQAQAPSVEPLRFVFTEYEPANFLDESGAAAGFFVDIIREALEVRLGVPVEMAVYPWPRCQYMVEEGLADMMATIPTAERRDYAVVVDTPIWIKRYKLYAAPGHAALEAMSRMRSVEDLKRSGLSVISYLGNDWSRATLERSGVRTINAGSVEGMYRMLLAGRADVAIEDPILVERTLGALGLSGRLVETDGIVEQSAFHLMLSKRSPFAGLVDELDGALAEMRVDGTIESIMSRYR